MYNWFYGTPISGLSFPMVTASGPYAAGYAATALSAEISRDGRAWTSLSGRISSIPGNGVYTIANLTAAEMQCYNWFIKITANSGSLEQGIAGNNISAITAILAAQVHTSAQIPVVTEVRNVSGLVVVGINQDKANYSVSGTVVLAPQVHTSAQIPIVTEVRNVSGNVVLAGITHTGAIIPVVQNISGKVQLNDNVHASAQIAVVTEVRNMSGNVVLAGINHAGATIPIVTQVNNLSGTVVVVANNDKTNYGINVSSVNAIRDIDTKDATALTSGTIAHDLRLARWFTWQNWNIDKTYTPDRLYMWDGTNMSTYFNLTDDANNTKRTRG